MIEKSIAVLPFKTISTTSDHEYLSDGITEAIIDALTQIKELKVTSRTSSFAFKNRTCDARAIGRQLGVSTILEGSLQVADNQICISIQLCRTDNGFTIWSERFQHELKHIFDLQDEISRMIAERLRENFGHLDIQDQLSEIPTNSVMAYQLYLKARYHQLKWIPSNIDQAIAFYKQSIKNDPQFSLAYFGISLCYIILASWKHIPRQEGLRQAKQALQTGYNLDKNAYLYHFAKATLCYWDQWDFSQSHKHLQKTIDCNPSFSEAHEALAEIYTVSGEFERALLQTHTILSINPLSPNHYFTRGNIYYLTGNLEKAISCADAALKIDPAFTIAIELKLACFILLNDKNRFQAYLNSMPVIDQPQLCAALFNLVNGGKNIEPNLEQIRSSAEKSTSRSSFIPWHIYFQLYGNNPEIAMDLLEESVNHKMGQVIYFRHDPFLRPLHNHPRFINLTQSLNKHIACVVNEHIETKYREATTPLLCATEKNLYKKTLEEVMILKSPFLNPDLTLKELAGIIDLHPNKLSRLLNEVLGKNFNDYINGFRLKTFQKLAVQDQYKHLSILGLAFESGFNSKTVFNTFFKKETGLTPGAWLKSAR